MRALRKVSIIKVVELRDCSLIMFDNDAVVLVDKEDVPKLMKVEFVQIKNKVYVKI